MRGVTVATTIDEARIAGTVFDILEESVLCSIATVTPEGKPHINIAYFSYSEALELFFLSHPASLHGRNLSRNPSAAVTVFSTRQRWAVADHGLQLFGTCRLTLRESEEEPQRSYGRRFAGYAPWRARLMKDDPGHEYRLYRFEVAALKLVDERRLGDGTFVCASVVRR